MLTDISAIPLALADSEVMVRVNAAPETRYVRLLAMAVEGSGFLGGTRVVWSPELTTIIGGRGAGKWAVLETIRYALDIKPFVETEYRDGLVKHSLESGGKLSVWLERYVSDGVCRVYRVDRIYGQKPRVYELTHDYRSETLVDLSPEDILGDEVAEKQIEIRKREEELRKNGAEILRLRRVLEQKEERQKQLEAIRHEIALYRREGLAEKLREMTLLSRDEEILRLIVSHAEQIGDIFEWTESEVEEHKREASRMSSEAESSNKHIVQSAAGLVDSLAGEFRAMFS